MAIEVVEGNTTVVLAEPEETNTVSVVDNIRYFTTPDITPLANQINTAQEIAIASFDYANTISSDADERANIASITANVAFDASNAAFNKANAANVFAYQISKALDDLNVTVTYANSAWDKANGANLLAYRVNAQLPKINTSLTIANVAFDRANAANYYAYLVDLNVKSAYAYANTISSDADEKANAALINSNAAYNSANAGQLTANVSYDKANAANYYAYLVDLNVKSAFAYANTISSDADEKANAAIITANTAYNKANAANYYAYLIDQNVQAAFAYANTISSDADEKANIAVITANAAFDKANVGGSASYEAWNKGNAAHLTANVAYDLANTANHYAYLIDQNVQAAFAYANTISSDADEKANAAIITSNLAFDTANAAFDSANNVSPQITPAFTTANTGYDKANAANVIASSAYDKANAALPNTSGVTFEGNLFISGSANVVNVLTTNIASFGTNSSKDKIRLYDSETPYAIGMTNKMTFGPLRDDWAMTFQMNDDIDRGFWWGDVAHTNAQGAMALTTDGNLYVARKIRIGYGESDLLDGDLWQHTLDISNNVNVATAITVAGLDLVPAIQYSYDKGNASHLTANTAYDKANAANIFAYDISGALTGINTTVTIANVAYDQANAANYYAYLVDLNVQAAFAYANTISSDADEKSNIAVITANVAYDSANAGQLTANVAFDSSNASQLTANASFDAANAAHVTANAVFDTANIAFDTANSNYDLTNNAFVTANVAYDSANAGQITANISFDTANGAYDSSNAGQLTANVSFDAANIAFDTANGAYDSANAGQLTANVTFDAVNAAYIQANSANYYAYLVDQNVQAVFAYANTVSSDADEKANAAIITANAAYDQANAANYLADQAKANALFANTVAQLAYNTANLAAGGIDTTARITANTAFDSSNSLNVYANSTYVKLTKTNQTITGNLSITGSLTVSGNTYTLDTENLRVSDPLIYLAGNNYSSDVVDIGFVGNYVNTTGQNVHTGLFRDATVKEYYLFQDYDKEPIPNHIDPAGNNFSLAVLNSAIRTSNLNLAGVNAVITLRSAYDQANVANTRAYQDSNIISQHNTVLSTINSAVTAAFFRANVGNGGSGSGVGSSSNTQVLYNDGFIISGSPYLTYESVTNTLNVANLSVPGYANITANTVTVSNLYISGNTSYVYANSIIVGDTESNAFVYSTQTTANQVIDIFSNTAYRSAFYKITMNAGTDYHSTQISLIHNDSITYITEYGSLYTSNSLGIFTADFNSSNVRLNITPTFAKTNLKIFRIATRL